ncbi:LTA synthase family protein [Bacillus sp. Marseille-P3800]|uniref:LTA synthase family protein n=1 Tax=Bacillus sp. Marseille-P3800 TaxID=2014782 RepID=UPI00210035BA|nr:LTA synthase family protein [Bacillus sp. Marseille-P3800]
MDWLLFLISPIGSLLFLFSLSFVGQNHIRPLVFCFIYLLSTALLISNLLYYRFYIDFLTSSVFLQLNNVGGLGSSTVELFSPYDLLLLIDVLFFCSFAWFFNKQKEAISRPNGKPYFITAGSFLALTVGLSLVQNPYVLQHDYERDQMVSSLGIYNYQLINVAQSIQAPLKGILANQTVASEIKGEMVDPPPPDTSTFGLASGKNVVFISLESVQNFVIQQENNGEELTPFLNRLLADSFYFPNIYDQTAQGKSSDMEFMLDTGFYPLSSGSAFVRSYTNTFQSLPRILEQHNGYTSAAFHANDATFWNRELMYDALGYHHFFSKEMYNVTEDESVNYGLKDKPFFEQSVPLLKELEEPYSAKFITLTNHFPFLLEEEDQLIEEGETDVGIVNRYFTTVRYLDAAVEQFFQQLKDEDMYEDTMFVLYGDHYGISRQYEKGVHQFLDQEETTFSHIDLQKVPLIIHIPGQTGRTIETEGGQIDIHSTVLHLLGISTNANLSFSYDLFTRPSDMPIIFRDGHFIAQDFLFADHACYERSSNTMIPIQSCSAKQAIVREQLQLSDDFLLGDLLRFME